MPFAGLGLHIVIAIYFAVHAVRSGQDRYWLFILFAFPLLGSLVYALAVWLPDVRNSGHGRRVIQSVGRMMDPLRELREAQDAVEVVGTPDNRLRLADALMAANRASEAVVQYQTVLNGIYAKDGPIIVRYANALLESGNANVARVTLENLIRDQPKFKSPEGHLIYARAVASLGDRVKAREEFDVLVGYFAGLEARARYAALLMEWGEREKASALVAESLRQAQRMPDFARELNKPWLADLKRLESQLV